MQIAIKRCKIVIIWLLCVLLGFSVHKLVSTPTTPFVGFWKGQSIVDYNGKQVHQHVQLIVDDANNEMARLIVQFEPFKKTEAGFNSSTTASIKIIKRQNHQLTFSISDMSYSNKEALENYIGRSLPTEGYVISGQGWTIDKNTIVLFLTLGFGENMGLVLQRST